MDDDLTLQTVRQLDFRDNGGLECESSGVFTIHEFLPGLVFTALIRIDLNKDENEQRVCVNLPSEFQPAHSDDELSRRAFVFPVGCLIDTKQLRYDFDNDNEPYHVVQGAAVIPSVQSNGANLCLHGWRKQTAVPLNASFSVVVMAPDARFDNEYPLQFGPPYTEPLPSPSGSVPQSTFNIARGSFGMSQISTQSTSVARELFGTSQREAPDSDVPDNDDEGGIDSMTLVIIVVALVAFVALLVIGSIVWLCKTQLNDGSEKPI